MLNIVRLLMSLFIAVQLLWFETDSRLPRLSRLPMFNIVRFKCRCLLLSNCSDLACRNTSLKDCVYYSHPNITVTNEIHQQLRIIDSDISIMNISN